MPRLASNGANMPIVHIGTSGWHYPHWQGRFYPSALPASAWLGYYARQFDSVEINVSFYRLPSLAAARAWREQTPPGFRFALKASRYITHMKKLRAPHRSLRAFLAVARALGPKCGPLLFQLPPRWRCNPSRLAAFLRALPKNRACAFEFRDPSWHTPEVYALLRRHNAAFCIYELAGFESPHVLTADITYVRLHGPAAYAYGGSYPDAALAAWAGEIRSWQKLKHVYVFFDNDEAGYAVRNALTLQALLTGRHAHP
jgi:uncharacterized protein YecE (DUF72 family)